MYNSRTKAKYTGRHPEERRQESGAEEEGLRRGQKLKLFFVALDVLIFFSSLM